MGLKLFDFVSLRIVNKWHEFFSYYDGYRLPASIAAFVPFTRETIHHDSSYKIIFTGDSTSGGLLYHHSQAIPAYLNTILNGNGKQVHTYNLAFSGAHLSEQYLLMKEFIGSANMIIFPIHYSFFAGRGVGGTFISHPELRDFMSEATVEDLSPLGITPRSKFEKSIESVFSSVSYTYKFHQLLPYITIGKPLRFWLRDQIANRIRLTSQVSTQVPLPISTMVSFEEQSSQVKEQILRENQILWESIKPITEDNINLQYLNKIGKLAKSNNKQILAYFVPLDRETLFTNQNFNKETFAQIIQTAKKTLTQWNIDYIDFNDGNPCNLESHDFYNPDHLLPEGNQKIASCIAQRIQNDF
jgi:hypothetical protein